MFHARHASQTLLFVTVLCQATVFAYVFTRTLIPRSFLDSFTWVSDYVQRREGWTYLSYLWMPHNEHHMPLIRIAVAADVEAFGGLNVVLILLSLLCTLGTILLILSRTHQSEKGSSGLQTCLRLLVISLILTVPAAVDCSVAINAAYPITVFFAVSTFALASVAEPLTPRLTAIIVCALLASGATATGLSVWPILLWIGWNAGWPRSKIVVVLVIGFGYSAAYLATLDLSAMHRAVPDPIKMGTYFLSFLGLPLSRAPTLAIPARLLGAVLLCSGVILIARRLTKRVQDAPSQQFGMALILFTFATAVLAAIGRVDLEPEIKLPVRYALFVAPLHIGLLSMAYPVVLSHLTTNARAIGVRWGALAFAVFVLGLQVAGIAPAITASDRFNSALDAFAAGQRDPSMTTLVFPNLDFAETAQQQLARYLAAR